MEDLDRCPFCGAEAEYQKDVRFEDRDFLGWFVICTECEIRTLTYKTAKKAARVWNRRAP